MLNYISALRNILSHPLNRKNKFSAGARMVLWKFFQRVFNQDVIVELENSTKILIPANSSYGSLIQYNRGSPDLKETQILLHVLKKGDVFIDVGANIGYYSILALGQEATIFAFEPNKSLHKYILFSAHLNNDTKKLHLSSCVISDKNGYEQFVFEKHSEVSHIEQEKGSPSTKKIHCTTLDEIAKNHHLEKIKLVKIDVEGAEPQVIKGLEKMLKKKSIAYILFEHDPKNNKNQDYLNFIYNLSRKKSLYAIHQFDISPFVETDLSSKKNLFAVLKGKSSEISKILSHTH